jgi:hypothetical protein
VIASGTNLTINLSGQRVFLQPAETHDKFEGSGRLLHQALFFFDRDSKGEVTGFTALDQKFLRVPGKDPQVPEDWRRFLGSYGPEFIPLIISVKFGHLYAMTENEYDNRLTPVNRNVFKMPQGLYIDEQLVFLSYPDGNVHTAVLANMSLPKRKK